MKSETTTRPLRELVRAFQKGSILLPQFQRDYIWKPVKIRNLLDSLLRDFPIGGFYLWRPSEGAKDPKPKAFGEQRIAQEFFGYLIDGQQRLTSLEAAFGLYSTADKGGDEFQCFLDLAADEDERRRDTRVFVSYAGSRSVATRVERTDPALIPVEAFFGGPNYDLRRQTEEALRLLIGWPSKRIDAALNRFDRACAMLDRPIPCTTIYDVSDPEAVDIFSRLNKGGSQLREGDVRAAELARGRAVDVLKRMREFVAGDVPRRLGFGFSFAFRALVVFHRESAQFTALKPGWIEPATRGRSLVDSWRSAERALSQVLTFVDQRMGWARKGLLPSANSLIVLAAAFDKAGSRPDAEAEQRYRRWLCLTALRQVFQGSVETTINRFLRAIRDFRGDPSKALLDALKRDERRKIHSDDLTTQYAIPWGPMTQVMLSWLVSQHATNWTTSDSLDSLVRTDPTGSVGGELTVHHIFPTKILTSDLGKDVAFGNIAANYALISRSANSEFGDRRPEEVLAALTPDQRRAAALQFFDEGAGDRLAIDRCDEFFEWRAEHLAKALNEYLGIE